MNTLIVNKNVIPLDKEGYLKNLSDWSPEVAEALAQAAGITLTPAHWEVLNAIQGFYQTYDLSPSQRPFVKHIANTLGAEKGRSIYLMKLFSESPAKMAARIAGLPRPSNCF
ncbi:TusE/DsrC/DsvC family sulfur relay protein [Kistimonas asteriae]|uniref:TusE/DsrC/DsvC family sulfur relay protein n=1 Tax=Kistimonas asteriae TaxID=517724 RepID=UPI001BA5A963|nr:TusE/DsrC/DsvC family sulfur relay protein [Kistimonas asteriae]